MVGVCENAKPKNDGGSSIRIGATGKVSALMMQELDSNIIIKTNSSKKPEIGSRRMQTAPVSVSCGGSSKRLQRMVSMNGGGTSKDARNQVRPEKKKKKKKKEVSRQAVHRIPMLDSEDLWVDKTPIRAKEHDKKVARRIVETVDLKCGKHEGDWSIIPIGNQLRRLSFSKISN